MVKSSLEDKGINKAYFLILFPSIRYFLFFHYFRQRWKRRTENTGIHSLFSSQYLVILFGHLILVEINIQLKYLGRLQVRASCFVNVQLTQIFLYEAILYIPFSPHHISFSYSFITFHLNWTRGPCDINTLRPSFVSVNQFFTFQSVSKIIEADGTNLVRTVSQMKHVIQQYL